MRSSQILFLTGLGCGVFYAVLAVYAQAVAAGAGVKSAGGWSRSAAASEERHSEEAHSHSERLSLSVFSLFGRLMAALSSHIR